MPTPDAQTLTLNKQQHAFINSREMYVGLFGGVGNGKTTAACLAIIEHAVKNANNLCLIGRQTYPELRDSTKEVFLSTLRRLYPPAAYTENKSENSLTFWNKSTVIFRHLDDTATLLGPNLGAFYIDQAEEVDEESFLTLQSRLRRDGCKYRQGYVTGNPQGRNWVYYKFGMDKAGREANWQHGINYRMITAPTFANEANLPPNYIAQLQESYSPEWFARYVEGSWDAFEGQIFDVSMVKGYDALPEITMVLTACDPAISQESAACNTCFCTLGVGVDGLIYDVETIAGHYGFYETLEKADGIHKRHKNSYLGVENTAYQMALVEACTRNFPDVQVESIDADRDKFRRAKSVSHIINRGQFRTNNRELLDEMTAFRPDAPKSQRKDRVDALVHCLHMVQKYAPINAPEVDPYKDYQGLNSHQAWFKATRDYAKRQRDGGETGETFSGSYQTPNPDFY